MNLQRFFDDAVRRSLGDLARRDDPAAEYLADLLTRFAHTDNLYPRGERAVRLETVAEMLLDIQEVWDTRSPHFRPEHEVALRRHVGDYALFMSGVFQERVARLAAGRYYVAEGKRAYRFVAEHQRAARGEPGAALFRRLSDQFEAYVGVLDYARKVYFRDHPDHPFFRLAFG
jgi:hypothetical protein